MTYDRNPTLKKSELLQDLWSRGDQEHLEGEADWFTDRYHLGGARTDTSLDGFEKGVEMHARLLEVRKIKGNEDADFYRVECGDTTMVFVGTEKGLANMFRSNPAKGD